MAEEHRVMIHEPTAAGSRVPLHGCGLDGRLATAAEDLPAGEAAVLDREAWTLRRDHPAAMAEWPTFAPITAEALRVAGQFADKWKERAAESIATDRPAGATLTFGLADFRVDILAPPGFTNADVASTLRAVARLFDDPGYLRASAPPSQAVPDATGPEKAETWRDRKGLL